MIRVEKLKGFGNVQIVEAEIPIPKDEEILASARVIAETNVINSFAILFIISPLIN